MVKVWVLLGRKSQPESYFQMKPVRGITYRWMRAACQEALMQVVLLPRSIRHEQS